jgi:hypothetical protein
MPAYKQILDEFNKVHELPFAVIYVHKKMNLGLVEFKQDKEIDLEAAKTIVGLIENTLDTSKRCYGITWTRTGTSVTPEGRDYFANCELSRNHTEAMAVVFNGLPQRMLFNFYLNFHKPVTLTKGFNQLGKAFKWLQKIEQKTKLVA